MRFLFLVFILSACGSPESDTTHPSTPTELRKIHEWVFNDFDLLANPMEAGVLTDTSLVVIDRARFTINHFSKEGQLISSVGRQGRGPMEFSNITQSAIRSSGDVAIADLQNARILIYNVFSKQHRMFNFMMGWGMQLQWVGNKLLITVSPFGRTLEQQSILEIHSYDMETEELTPFYELPVDLDISKPSEKLTCLFCPIHFDEQMRFYAASADTSYRVYRVDPNQEETFLFTRQSDPIPPYTEEEKKIMMDRRNAAMAQVGRTSNAIVPEYRRRIHKVYVDHKGRLWVLMNKDSGEVWTFDLFDEKGQFLGSVRAAGETDSPQFTKDWVIFRNFSGEEYHVNLYQIVS